MYWWLLAFFLGGLLQTGVCQECPRGWEDYDSSCYKFNRSPLRTRDEAREACQAYNCDLISINTFEEHRYVVEWLRVHDPQHRRWFTSGFETSENVWAWEGDGTAFSNIESLWLPQQEISFWKYVSYNFSEEYNRWGLHRVPPGDSLAFICEIPKERLHDVYLQERPIDYGYEVQDWKHIPQGPRITLEPKNVMFDVSGRIRQNEISLRCVASGYPPPTYKWFKEERQNDASFDKYIDPLSNGRYTQTDGTLTIHRPDMEIDRGKYHCTAENKFGTVLSRPAELSFDNIGEFNKHRAGDSGKEYWGKSVSCDPPQLPANVHFFWVRNSFPNFVEQSRRVFVSSDGNMYFSSLEKIDNAYYSCNVQSVISSTGQSGPFFSLAVDPASSGQKLQFPNNFPKAFPEAPLAGSDVRLECVAYGYPVPFYNWTRLGGPMPEGARVESYGHVLLLPSIRIEDMGDYVCTASTGEDAIRKTVTLSVQASPEFTIELENQVLDEDSKFMWTCEAFGIPEVTYSWYKDGKPLHGNETLDRRQRYKVYNNVLHIDGLVRGIDEGMYQCRASNSLGIAYTTAQLRMLTLKPHFQKYPLESEIFAAEDGNITIPCRPEAAPVPEYTWRRDGYNVPTGGRIQIMGNGFLRIQPVRPEDEGNYTCTAKNSLGADSSHGRLVVLPPPRNLEAPPPKVVAIVRTMQELPCQALAPHALDMAYIWLHNDLRIYFDKQPQYMVGRMPGYLLIPNVTFAEAGRYTCIAKTSVGRVYTYTELLVVGPPGVPGAVLASNINATSGIVEWADGTNHGFPITSYAIQGRTDHNCTWRELCNVTYAVESRETPGRRQVQLGEVLSPWSKYEFRVLAANALGVGEPSDPSPQYNTAIHWPLVVPHNIGGGGGKAGSLTISWTPLHPEEWNAPEVWYRIYYRPAWERGEPRKKDLRKLGNIGLYVVPVGEENYYSPYEIQVQAVNLAGDGPISDPVEIYSAEGMPQVQPSGVYAVPFNSTSLNVTWTPLDITREKIRGRLIGHRIKYWKNDENAETEALILLKRGIENWGLIVGLQPNTEYRVAVMAYNDAGSGPESEYFVAKTFRAAPLRPPTSVKVKALSDTSVKVTWRGVLPTIEEESIQGYKVRYWESDQDLTSAKEVYRPLDGGDLEAVVSGLVPGKVYKLRVLAWSFGGDGKMSSPPWEFKVGEGVASAYSGAGSTVTVEILGLLVCLVLVALRR
ncbi:contactin-like [Ornithodoros turicata]|uniref:contactin-like n=1 Tax=Ornithodoros turicata TaxID=34597 RepID=UPI003139F26C